MNNPYVSNALGANGLRERILTNSILGAAGSDSWYLNDLTGKPLWATDNRTTDKLSSKEERSRF